MSEPQETGSDQWDTPPGHFDSDTDEWATPPSLLRPLADAVGGFDLDPCSGAEEKSIAEETYTAEDDGLTSPWFGTVWCNPPYSDMEAWMRRAVDQSNREETDLILVLAPARTSTQWFHDYAVEADLLAFLEGRLTFGNPREQVRNAPFPSLIAAFGDVPWELVEALDRRGAIYDQDSHQEHTEQKRLATDGGTPETGSDRCWDHEDCPRDDCDGELQQQDRFNVMCLSCEAVFAHYRRGDRHWLEDEDYETVAQKRMMADGSGDPDVEEFVERELRRVQGVARNIADDADDLSGAMIVVADGEGVETYPYVAADEDPREMSLWMLGAFMAHVADAASSASGRRMRPIEAAQHAARLINDPEPDHRGGRDV